GREEESDGSRNVLPWFVALRNSSLRVFVIQQFANAGADTVFNFLTGAYFLSRGVDLAEVGVLASLPLWGGAIGGMLGGYYNDLLMKLTGHRRWVRSLLGFAGKAIACGVMVIAINQESVVAAGLALFVVKFFSDWTQPTVWGTCTDLGGRYSATVFSIINTSGTLGGIFCPLAFGVLLEFFKSEQVVNGETTTIIDYTPVFVMVAAFYMLSAACWFLIDCSDSLDKTERDASLALEQPRCTVKGVLFEFLRMLLPLAGGLAAVVIALAQLLPELESVPDGESGLWWQTLLKLVVAVIAGAFTGGGVGHLIAKFLGKYSSSFQLNREGDDLSSPTE
ncbi:MAG: hypothetical protein CMJ78_23160, partial [Planctomycetaceae bacterium]|nr:hypothetical protein [Planctomycetaceae bacterium]